MNIASWRLVHPAIIACLRYHLIFQFRVSDFDRGRDFPGVFLQFDFADFGQRPSLQEQSQTLEALPVLLNMQLTIGFIVPY